MTDDRATPTVLCVGPEADLDALAALVRQAGPWRVVTMQDYEVPPDQVDAYLTMNVSPSGLLASRLENRGAVPWIAIRGATEPSPSLWLAALPEPTFFAMLMAQLMTPAGPAPIWRRKSDMIIGHSAVIRTLLHTLDRLAPVQTPVLITGESGTGKELVAQALHYSSPRAKEPFVAINCAAIPETLFEAEIFGYQRGAFTGATQSKPGAFESANHGTLFLDEIGELPLNMQAKLLRVLETGEVQRVGSNELRKVTVRLVSATNRDLQAEVKNNTFRDDLYYRLQVYPVHIPPLRERVEDVPALAAHHLAVIAAREKRPAPRLTSAALEKLVGYPWPGNVRELVNTLERAALLAGEHAIDVGHVVFSNEKLDTAPSLSYAEAKVRFEVDYYGQLMRAVGGNVSLAAKLGRKTRKEIYDALKRLGLTPESFRASPEISVAAPGRGRARAAARRGRTRHSERSRASSRSLRGRSRPARPGHRCSWS